MFAIDYLKCIKIWNKDKSTLSALLGRAFKNRILEEHRKRWAQKRQAQTISLDENIFEDDKDKPIALKDALKDKTDIEKDFENLQILNVLLSDETIKLYLLGYSQKEIAKKLNVSQAHISRKIKKIKSELREELYNG